MLLLFEKGQLVPWTDARCSDCFLEPLERIGGPRVIEAFTRSLVERGHRSRKVALATALRASDDPRVEGFFDQLLGVVERDELANQADPLLERNVQGYAESALDRYTARGDDARLTRWITALLRSSKGVNASVVGLAAEIAAERGLAGTADAMVHRILPWLDDERPHYASQRDFFVLGSALARIDPARATEVFEPAWKAFLGYGSLEEIERSRNLMAIGTAVLAPLLASTKRATYVPFAKRFASALATVDVSTAVEWSSAVRHLLRGARASGDPFASELARRYEGLAAAGDEALGAAIAEEVRATLGERRANARTREPD
jgi:hypothetical protein